MESEDNPRMNIGERVRLARIAANVSQSALGRRVGMTQAAISQLETGASSNSTILPAIAFALGVNALWLYSERGPKYPIENLNAKEQLLIADYRSATVDGKKFIEKAGTLAPKSTKFDPSLLSSPTDDA